MGIKLEIDYSKTIPLPCEQPHALAYLCNYEKAIPENFPGLKSFTQHDEAQYEWKFGEITYGGHTIAINLMTEFRPEGEEIQIVSTGASVNSELNGRWRVQDSGQSSTDLTFEVKLETELPIPFFLKAMVVPIAKREISNFFDRYLANVEKSLSQ